LKIISDYYIGNCCTTFYYSWKCY